MAHVVDVRRFHHRARFRRFGRDRIGLRRPDGQGAGFGLLRAPDVTAVAAVPVVTLGAAYFLARNVFFGRRRPAWAVAAGTVVTGLWSLVIGAATLSAFG